MKRIFTSVTAIMISLAMTISPIAAGWYQKENGEWGYQRANGELARNIWVKSGNDWFYFDENGNIAKNAWVDGGKYYVDDDGRMLRNTFTPDGYWVGNNGVWVPSGNAQESAAGTASQTATRYSDMARRDFQKIKDAYPTAQLSYAYAQPFTNANGHSCVLVVLKYEIISRYSEEYLHDLTTGKVLHDPARYYENKADRSYGGDKTKELNNANAVIDAGIHALDAIQSVLGNGVNTGTGEFYYPEQLGF